MPSWDGYRGLEHTVVDLDTRRPTGQELNIARELLFRSATSTDGTVGTLLATGPRSTHGEVRKAK